MLARSQLHPYQLRAIAHAFEIERCALFLDMGLGKTISVLTVLDRLLYDELGANKVLIVAPKRVVESVWRQEAANWEHTQRLRFSTIAGTAKQRNAAVYAKADIYLLSRDNVVWFCQEHPKAAASFDTLVIDELSSFKNPRAKRFKELRKISRTFDRVIGLTGTPAPNGLIDLWAQMYLIDGGERLEKTLTKFRDRYFVPDKRNGMIVYSYRPKSHTPDEIEAKLSDIVISMKSEDYLQLPDLLYIDVPVTLDAATMRHYKDFERENVLEFNENVNALNAAGLTNKLLQFANGAIYDEERNVVPIHEHKIDALKEIVEAEEGSVLIAYAYEHDRDRILNALSDYDPVLITDKNAIERWNNKELKILLAHPASAGHGLNLQKGGSLVIWFGLTWSLELYQQFNKRLHRQGQDCAVRIMRLIATDTLDERISKVLSGKDATQEQLMQALKSRIDRYLI